MKKSSAMKKAKQLSRAIENPNCLGYFVTYGGQGLFDYSVVFVKDETTTVSGKMKFQYFMGNLINKFAN